MRKDANAFHNLRGTVLHQTIVGGNVGFTLCGVNNECFDFVAAAAQFGPRRETRAAQPGHAELMDTFNQRLPALGAVVAPAVTVDPAIFPVSVDDYAQLRQGRRMRNGMRSNRHHGTGGRGVNGQHAPATKGQRLAAQDAIALFDAEFTLCADMLFQRHDVARRQRDLTQRRAVRLGFHLWRMDTAIKVPNLLFSERGE